MGGDAADRDIADVNVGTNGGSAWTRPSSVPTDSNNVLVTSYTYNPAGDLDTTTDPRGIVTKNYYDALGRTTETIAAYTNGTPTSDTNQITEYGYDGDDNLISESAADVDPGSSTVDWETTDYIYGVNTSAISSSNPNGGSAVNDNDLLAEIEYPDPTTGMPGSSAADDVLYTYDALGEKATMTDQNGNTHAYTYDSLGRETMDTVTTLGAGVDGSVMALGYSYNALGLPYQQTSYDGSGNIVNQVQDEYNGLGQLTAEYQSHSGSVNTSTTPEVQYVYSDPSNGSRLMEMIYPNGRILHYGYNNNAVDNAIGRVDYLADDDGSGNVGAHLQDEQYLGLDTLVSQADGNGITLTYLQQPGDTQISDESNGGDQYTGLNQFGQVVDQNWVNTSTGASTDRFQYAYDADGNVLYENNLVDPSLSELFHANSTSSGDDSTAYDPLNRVTNFERGTLTASGNNGSTLDTITPSNFKRRCELARELEFGLARQLGGQ